MHEVESAVLQRDVNAVTIPDGEHMALTQGQIVTIHQSLGNNFTVVAESGHMARIDGTDADALGKDVPKSATIVEGTDPESIENNAWEVMRTVYDPEIPVNIVDLGLVYYCKVTPIGEQQNNVEITMTLTAPGCGMGPIIQGDVERLVKDLPGVQSVNVEVVLDPPWSQDMMSEVAKLELGML